MKTLIFITVVIGLTFVAFSFREPATKSAPEIPKQLANFQRDLKSKAPPPAPPADVLRKAKVPLDPQRTLTAIRRQMEDAQAAVDRAEALLAEGR